MYYSHIAWKKWAVIMPYIVNLIHPYFKFLNRNAQIELTCTLKFKYYILCYFFSDSMCTQITNQTDYFDCQNNWFVSENIKLAWLWITHLDLLYQYICIFDWLDLWWERPGTDVCMCVYRVIWLFIFKAFWITDTSNSNLSHFNWIILISGWYLVLKFNWIYFHIWSLI